MQLEKMTSRIAIAAALIAIPSAPAFAAGTDAGRSVENTFTLEYQVDGVVQGTITNDPAFTVGVGEPSPVIDPAGPTDFTVDRMIDIAVTADNSGLVVPSNAQDRILQFTVTNLGNDNQAYSFSLADVAGDDFDATGLEITYSRAAYDLNGDGDTLDVCEAAVSGVSLTATVPGTAAASASFTCDIPADLPFTVQVSGDIPEALAENNTDSLVLVAETRNPVGWVFEATPPTAGGVSVSDADGSNTIDGLAENVFADGSGSSEESARDGLMSALSSFVVVSPDLFAQKRVWVLKTSSDTVSCQGEAIPAAAPTTEYPTPGACVLYTIEVTNAAEAAGATAENISIADVLPENVAFVSANTSGFGVAGSLTYKKADNTTDCDGAAGESCTVSVSGAALDSNAGATDAVAQLFIRALVR